MSDKIINPNPVSNEGIVDEIIKDLTPLSVEEHPDDSIINPGTSAGDFVRSTDKVNQPTEIDSPLNYLENDSDQNKDNDVDTDSDEEALKDAELTLTDDRKSELRIIAEELKTAGNNAFKSEEFELSIEKYTDGLRICPLSFSDQRAILYCNRAAAKMKLLNYKKATNDCTKAIELDETYIKAYNRRAVCNEFMEKFDESLADFKKVLELDSSNVEAQRAIVRLPPLIEEKNEKLKTEMFGKLKDIGNMFLKPFGLSTNNFQMEEDPDTKGYKINFKQ